MRENPRLIYLSVSAYGQGGPLRERRGIDPIIQTTAGIPAEQGGGGAPELVQGSFVDYMTGALAYGAVMMALYARERTGGGPAYRRIAPGWGHGHAVRPPHVGE